MCKCVCVDMRVHAGVYVYWHTHLSVCVYVWVCVRTHDCVCNQVPGAELPWWSVMGHHTDRHTHLGQTHPGVTGFSKTRFLIDPNYIGDSFT